MGAKTKIDWCDATWNPVTGCLHGCEYCYASRMADRFGGFDPEGSPNWRIFEEPRTKALIGRVDEMQVKCDKRGRTVVAPYPFRFTPTFHAYRLDKPQHWKKPRTIFVCSMADLFGDWVPDEWIAEVFQACEAAPQHRYLFLTKNPARYDALIDAGVLPERRPGLMVHCISANAIAVSPS